MAHAVGVRCDHADLAAGLAPQLEYFVMVATHRTMAAAAAECRVSQSAISLAVAQLERGCQARSIKF